MADLYISQKLGSRAEAFRLVNTSLGGVNSLSGQQQVIVSAASRWQTTVTFNVFTGKEDRAVLLYRSILRRGRAARIIVPERDARGPGELAGLKVVNSVPHSDGAKFSDSSGYKSRRFVSQTNQDANLNDTLLRITLSRGLSLTAGMRFSTPDYRMHEIDEVLAFDNDTSWTVRILPWLRAAYPSGTELNFDEPKCAMRLASDETGQFSVEQRQMVNPSVEFTEYF
jgi:hypothetical protein